jgi:hypothetical protein
MDDEIDATPPVLQSCEGGINRGDVFDVAGQYEIGADRLRKWLYAPAERVALIGEGELCAMSRERLGNAPGNRVIVRNPHHQAALAAH